MSLEPTGCCSAVALAAELAGYLRTLLCPFPLPHPLPVNYLRPARATSPACPQHLDLFSNLLKHWLSVWYGTKGSQWSGRRGCCPGPWRSGGIHILIQTWSWILAVLVPACSGVRGFILSFSQRRRVGTAG